MEIQGYQHDGAIYCTECCEPTEEALPLSNDIDTEIRLGATCGGCESVFDGEGWTTIDDFFTDFRPARCHECNGITFFQRYDSLSRLDCWREGRTCDNCGGHLYWETRP